jgi:hypothetical protein
MFRPLAWQIPITPPSPSPDGSIKPDLVATGGYDLGDSVSVIPARMRVGETRRVILRLSGDDRKGVIAGIERADFAVVGKIQIGPYMTARLDSERVDGHAVFEITAVRLKVK